MEDYICLPKSILNWKWFKHPKVSVFFTDCLYSMNEEGMLNINLYRMMISLKLKNKKQAINILKKLKSTNEISYKYVRYLNCYAIKINHFEVFLEGKKFIEEYDMGILYAEDRICKCMDKYRNSVECLKCREDIRFLNHL